MVAVDPVNQDFKVDCRQAQAVSLRMATVALANAPPASQTAGLHDVVVVGVDDDRADEALLVAVQRDTAERMIVTERESQRRSSSSKVPRRLRVCS
jgi:hypothetical protein